MGKYLYLEQSPYQINIMWNKLIITTAAATVIGLQQHAMIKVQNLGFQIALIFNPQMQPSPKL